MEGWFKQDLISLLVVEARGTDVREERVINWPVCAFLMNLRGDFANLRSFLKHAELGGFEGPAELEVGVF